MSIKGELGGTRESYQEIARNFASSSFGSLEKLFVLAKIQLGTLICETAFETNLLTHLNVQYLSLVMRPEKGQLEYFAKLSLQLPLAE